MTALRQTHGRMPRHDGRMKALLLVAVPVCATAALASCGVEREPGRVLNVVGDPASRTLELDTASCNQNAAADVDESASEIRIALTVDGVGRDRKSTRQNSSHQVQYRMPSSA